MFTYLYFWAFFDDFDTQTCRSLFGCIFAMIDSTWKDSVFDVTQFDYSGENPFWGGRFITDAIFLIIVLKIVSEIFTGIITDRFNDSRTHIQEVKDDEAVNCFICGKSWDDIEKQNENFNDHI